MNDRGLAIIGLLLIVVAVALIVTALRKRGNSLVEALK